MALFTVVDDGYDVTVYGSIKAVVKFVVDNEFRLSQDDWTPASSAAVRKALKERRVVRLYVEDRSDWSYRIESQTRIFK